MSIQQTIQLQALFNTYKGAKATLEYLRECYKNGIWHQEWLLTRIGYGESMGSNLVYLCPILSRRHNDWQQEEKAAKSAVRDAVNALYALPSECYWEVYDFLKKEKEFLDSCMPVHTW